MILAVFLLVQHVHLHQVSAGTCLLSPPTKVSLKETDLCLRSLHNVIHAALVIYKLDAIQRCTKDEIVKKCSGAFTGLSDVRFELDHIDVRSKGWTRYYPFSVGRKNFIIRIFLTEELAFQPKAAVLYEGAVDFPRVTFQILPSINETLKTCRIRPYITYAASQADASL